MRINGQQVTSKSIVVGPGDRAEIELPGGLVPIDFRTNGGETKLAFEDGKLIFYNFNNSLGQGSVVSITPPGGAPVPLRVVVHALGEGPATLRALQYTVG